MVRINNPTDYTVMGAEMRITSNYEDIEMNQWDRTMRLLLKRIEELESKLSEVSKRVEKLEKPFKMEPEFPKYDGDGKPLDIHGNTWDTKSTYDGSENH